MPIFSPDRHACAPSYVKLTKQPITGGEYRPLANDEDSNTCAPSAFSGHHGPKLYTQKSAIHAISDNASVFIPKVVDALHLPKTANDESIDEAINEAANDNTHSAPLSAEIQLAQANEHPLMQAIEGLQTIRTHYGKSTLHSRTCSCKSCQNHRPRHPHSCHSSKDRMAYLR